MLLLPDPPWELFREPPATPNRSGLREPERAPGADAQTDAHRDGLQRTGVDVWELGGVFSDGISHAVTGWTLQPRTLNLRVEGSIPSRLTNFS